MEKEFWNDVVGYEGLYQISNLGRVKASARTFADKNGRVSRLKEKILKQSISNTGYYYVSLRKDNAAITTNVHRLIAEAFIPNPEKKRCVNHIDGDKTNNAIQNLEWVTHKENMQHASGANLLKYGSSRVNAKLNEEQVRFIRANSKKNGGTMTYIEIAEKFNVSPDIVGNVARRENWKHVE